MLSVLRMGGFTTGGLNFDAKVRRESFEPMDLFYAHIGGMDAFARGLKIAAAIRADGRLAQARARSATPRGTRGWARRSRRASIRSRAWRRSRWAPPTRCSGIPGRQEFIENLLNDFI